MLAVAAIEIRDTHHRARMGLERVSRGEFGELLVASQYGGQAEEGQEVAAFAFVSHGEAAVAEEPGYGSLDLPPVPTARCR